MPTAAPQRRREPPPRRPPAESARRGTANLTEELRALRRQPFSVGYHYAVEHPLQFRADADELKRMATVYGEQDFAGVLSAVEQIEAALPFDVYPRRRPGTPADPDPESGSPRAQSPRARSPPPVTVRLFSPRVLTTGAAGGFGRTPPGGPPGGPQRAEGFTAYSARAAARAQGRPPERAPVQAATPSRPQPPSPLAVFGDSAVFRGSDFPSAISGDGARSARGRPSREGPGTPLSPHSPLPTVEQMEAVIGLLQSAGAGGPGTGGPGGAPEALGSPAIPIAPSPPGMFELPDIPDVPQIRASRERPASATFGREAASRPEGPRRLSESWEAYQRAMAGDAQRRARSGQRGRDGRARSRDGGRAESAHRATGPQARPKRR